MLRLQNFFSSGLGSAHSPFFCSCPQLQGGKSQTFAILAAASNHRPYLMALVPAESEFLLNEVCSSLDANFNSLRPSVHPSVSDLSCEIPEDKR